jgi:hypothetical protein
MCEVRRSSLEFKRLKDDDKDGGVTLKNNADIFEAMLNKYPSHPSWHDAIEGYVSHLRELSDISRAVFKKRVEEANELIGYYWKVTEVMAGGEEYPLCYMFVYDYNPINDYIFALVSPSETLFENNSMNYYYCGNFSLAEKSFNITKLGENICGIAIKFEDVSEEEMLDNAKMLCEKVFKRRKEKLEQKQQEILKMENKVLD